MVSRPASEYPHPATLRLQSRGVNEAIGNCCWNALVLTIAVLAARSEPFEMTSDPSAHWLRASARRDELRRGVRDRAW